MLKFLVDSLGENHDIINRYKLQETNHFGCIRIDMNNLINNTAYSPPHSNEDVEMS